jgi:pimeloyl-ACP methyl ester carboxylesterase
MNPKTIIFIHGMYMNNLCWEYWIEYFQKMGYKCFAPAWPGRNKSVDILRNSHPDPILANLTLKMIVEHFADMIKSLEEKPIVIGHSMGGLVVQLILQQNLAAAGVAIDSAPPKGVISTKWSFFKSNLPHISPFIPQSQPIVMTFERFQYTFVNTMLLPDQISAFKKYVVPESRRVPIDALSARVDFTKIHPPLLFIAGGADHIIPASLNKVNYSKYKKSPSKIEYKEFPGRIHFTIGQKGWEEVADYINTWLQPYLM